MIDFVEVLCQRSRGLSLFVSSWIVLLLHDVFNATTHRFAKHMQSLGYFHSVEMLRGQGFFFHALPQFQVFVLLE